jgi:hypothetical protein
VEPWPAPEPAQRRAIEDLLARHGLRAASVGRG